MRGWSVGVIHSTSAELTCLTWLLYVPAVCCPGAKTNRFRVLKRIQSMSAGACMCLVYSGGCGACQSLHVCACRDACGMYTLALCQQEEGSHPCTLSFSPSSSSLVNNEWLKLGGRKAEAEERLPPSCPRPQKQKAAGCRWRRMNLCFPDSRGLRDPQRRLRRFKLDFRHVRHARWLFRPHQ